MLRRVLLALSMVSLACGACGHSPQASPDVPVDALTLPARNLELPSPRKQILASLMATSSDTRSQAQIDAAACTAPDGSWRCAMARPKTFGATGITPILPASWTVPNWFVNKSTGSDANTCTSSGSPCATKQEILVHRWGCADAPRDCPRFQQTTTLEQDASDTDNTDPLYLHCALEKGGNGFILQGPTPTVVTSTTLGAGTTARNRAAGANALLVAQFAAGAPFVGQMVQNTQAGKSSRAFVVSANGGNWNLSTPAVLQTPPLPADPYTEVNTWANGDTVNLLSLVAINVVDVSATIPDYNGAFDTALYIYQATIFDPSGATNDSIRVGPVASFNDATTQRSIAVQDSGDFLSGTVLQLRNFYNGGGLTSNAPVLVAGGAISSAAVTSNGQFFGPNSLIDGDYVSGGALTSGLIEVGSMFLGGQWTANGFTTIAATGLVTVGTQVIWGSGTNTINLVGSAHLAQLTGNNFQSTFTAPGLVTGIKLNGGTSVSCHTNADPDVFHTATTTPAHLDAACGAGTGLGSNGFQIGGASVANF